MAAAAFRLPAASSRAIDAFIGEPGMIGPRPWRRIPESAGVAIEARGAPSWRSIRMSKICAPQRLFRTPGFPPPRRRRDRRRPRRADDIRRLDRRDLARSREP